MAPSFSFIIPVYNRPEEIRELLSSIEKQEYDYAFEVVVVEDGSRETCKKIIENFSSSLSIQYWEKENTGPGDSRNYGMERAKGNYFLILDSDVILPSGYLREVARELERSFVDCFGGPDAAHASFSTVQKGINFAMTSFLTTGGVRGGRNQVGKFQPRSFNMGLSREAFRQSGGFGSIHPGEDPDLALRLKKLGYETRLFPDVFVYHKRRINWNKFYRQVYNFGLVRPILDKWHPESASITYWFPSFFSLGFILGLLLLFIGFPGLFYFYLFYCCLLFVASLLWYTDLRVAGCSVWAALVQFFGYGFGFCRSTYYIRILKENPETRFQKLFYKKC